MKLIQIGLFLLLSFLVITIHAQKFTTRTGTIIFDGKTPLEDGILGTNNQIYAILDVSNKKILMGGLTQGFNFTKQLMQQHFNENYAETSKYPNTSFKGSFTAPIDVNTKGTYKVDVTGILNFHGVNKTITVPATIIVQSSTQIIATAQFTVTPAEFNIAIPTVVKDKIAKTVNVSVNLDLLSK